MTRHEFPTFGLPYAPAGVDEHGRATATCPVCGYVGVGRDHKAAARKYAAHFERAAKQEEESQ